MKKNMTYPRKIIISSCRIFSHKLTNTNLNPLCRFSPNTKLITRSKLLITSSFIYVTSPIVVCRTIARTCGSTIPYQQMNWVNWKCTYIQKLLTWNRNKSTLLEKSYKIQYDVKMDLGLGHTCLQANSNNPEACILLQSQVVNNITVLFHHQSRPTRYHIQNLQCQ